MNSPQRHADTVEEQTAAVMRRFNDAFQLHDPSLLDDLIAPDCVLENSTPAPDGSRHVGRAACLALWKGIIATPGTRFDLEDVDVAGTRAVIRWRFRWGDDNASSVRGVNLMRVRDGLIVEGRGYVKGS
jgi:ketosteroid isomerase-like protein